MTAVSELNGKIYLFRGASGSQAYKNVEIFDTSSNTWTSASQMPTARSAAAAVTYNNNIYVIGGYTGNGYSWSGGSSVATVEMYNPITNSWTNKAPMPQAVGAISAAVYNNKIYVFGGLNTNTKSISTVQVYDPTSDSWSTKTSIPKTIHSTATVVYNDKIYLIGGKHIDSAANVSVNSFYEYNPNSDSWATLPNLSIVRGAPEMPYTKIKYLL